MKIFGMGGFELVIILVVILLIFGPKNLPKLGNALGKTMSNLRSGLNEGKKKKQEEDASDAEVVAEAADAADEAKPAELVGEVEETVIVDEAPMTADGAETEIMDEAEVAVSDAEAEVDEAFEAKRVKRVVRKKTPVE